VTEWAQNYIGLKYEKLGRGPESYDCWGIIIKVYKDVFGITLPDFLYTADIAGYIETVKNKKELFNKIESPETGDIVLMKIKTAPIHTGIYISPGFVLHGYNEITGIVFDKIANWQNQIEGFYRWVY